MRWILATGLLVHGIAHTVGFAVSWKLITSAENAYQTTIFGGLVDVGDAGIRAFGLLWLALAAAFVVAAAGVALQREWALPYTLAVTVLSLGMCVVAWPDSRIGLAINLVLVIVLAFGARMGIGLFYDGSPQAVNARSK